METPEDKPPPDCHGYRGYPTPSVGYMGLSVLYKVEWITGKEASEASEPRLASSRLNLSLPKL